MDQNPLVKETREAGKKLVEEFNKLMPLVAAYWLMEGENDRWRLYLISDKIDESNKQEAYTKAWRLCPPPFSNEWFDVTQIRVDGINNRVAQDIIDKQTQYPDHFPQRIRNTAAERSYIADSYVYALPSQAPA